VDQKPPAAAIESAHREHLSTLPLYDTTDFDDADRGFIAALSPCVIAAADGRVGGVGPAIRYGLRRPGFA
jgi:alkyl sulfatase BDS1-like metallo-beta-lactamase superfamily hydrolase